MKFSWYTKWTKDFKEKLGLLVHFFCLQCKPEIINSIIFHSRKKIYITCSLNSNWKPFIGEAIIGSFSTSILRGIWFGELKLRIKIKLLTDYDQNIVEGGMPWILHYFCLVQHRVMYDSCLVGWNVRLWNVIFYYIALILFDGM